jgi:hypothetical protein
MVDSGADATSIVVKESKVQRDGLFGLLTSVCVVALARGVHGASTTGGAIAAGTFFSLMIIGLVLVWRLVRRQGNRLLVSTDSIALASGAGTDPKRLQRAASDQIRFVVRGSGRYRYTALEGGADGVSLNIQFFNRTKVRDACVARGWHID